MAAGYRMGKGLACSVALLAATGCTSIQDVLAPAAPAHREASSASARPAPLPYQPVAFPMPPGSKIDPDHTLVVGSAEQWFGTLILSSDLSVNDVNAYYSRTLPERGWVALSSLISNRVVLQFVNRPRGTAAIVMIEPGGMLSQTQVQIVVAPLVAATEEKWRGR